MTTGSDPQGPTPPNDAGPPASSDPVVDKIVAEAVANARPAPAAAAAADQQRLLANRYRLQDLLGRGSMGAVWRAHDVILRRSVAVKEVLLPPNQTAEDNEIARERALREARAIAALSHPNVVTLFDVVEEDGRPWVVMELVPAKSLAEIIRDDGPLDPTEAARIGLAVLGALDAAHQVGITHRDVKPGNILVSTDGRVKLADFGISRKIDESQLTRTGLMVGSPSYIAPEVARGKEAGRPADIWGLGATLHCAVEGSPPFDLGDPVATLTAVVGEPPRPAPHAGPLRPIIDRTLVKDPRQRIQVDELRRMLSDVASRPSERSMTIPVRSVGPPPQSQPTQQRPVQQRPVQQRPVEQRAVQQGSVQQSRQVNPPSVPTRGLTPNLYGPNPPHIRHPRPPSTGSTAMQRGPQGQPSAPAKRRVGGWLAAAIVAVLALGTVVTAVAINNSGDEGTQGGQSNSPVSTSAPPSTSSASPPTSQSQQPKKPAIGLSGAATGSITIGEDVRSFGMKLPAGWQVGASTPTRVEFRQVAGSSNGATSVKAAVVANPLNGLSVEDAVNNLKTKEGSPDALPGFNEQSFETDDDTVLWQYSNDQQGAKRAGIMYAVAVDGNMWRLFFTSPLAQRGQLKQIAETAIQSFKAS